MAREPIPTWYFALVVVRKGDKFLLVREAKRERQYYLPAGRVEPGETLDAAARREALEETSVPVVLEGILRVEHTPFPDGYARMRVVYLARPADTTPPKSVPDEHSLGAMWVGLDEIDNYPLRGPEVRDLLEWVAAGAPAQPMRFIVREDASYRPA